MAILLTKKELIMHNIDSKSLSIISEGLDDMGNFTLVAATIIGLISVDLVFLLAIIRGAQESKDHERRRSNNSDRELFWLTQTYYHSWSHRCCHDYGYNHHRRIPNNTYLFSDEIFIAITVGVSLITTAAAIALAIHFHLTTMVMFLSGIWLTGFALKAFAYALKLNIHIPATDISANIPTAIAVIDDSSNMGELPIANAFIIDGNHDNPFANASAPPLSIHDDPFANASAPPLSILDAYTP
jgi:hypothetical protein